MRSEAEDSIKRMVKNMINDMLTKRPVTSNHNIDYSNIKNGHYIARIEDDIAIPLDEKSIYSKEIEVLNESDIPPNTTILPSK